jgi:CrcB protein
MFSYFVIFLGGGIGALMRYIITFFSDKHLGAQYPYGTFMINIVGCLFLGFILAIAANKTGNLNSNLILFLTIGIAGGFTTFSSFSYESLALIRNGQVVDSMSYLLLSPILGLIAVYLGTHIARLYTN